MKQKKHIIEFEKTGELYLFADDGKEADDSIFVYKITPLAGILREDTQYPAFRGSVFAVKNKENICIKNIPRGKYEIERIK